MLLVPHSGSHGITAQSAILVTIQQHTRPTGKGRTELGGGFQCLLAQPLLHHQHQWAFMHS